VRAGRFVVFHVRLCRFRGVMRGVLMMAVREVRVMRRRFMLPVFVVLGRLLVVMCRVLVVFGCCVMMLRCLLRHAILHAIAACAIGRIVELRYRLTWPHQIART
jgi:hypothetical protein